jgi:hypothetical protein
MRRYFEQRKSSLYQGVLFGVIQTLQPILEVKIKESKRKSAGSGLDQVTAAFNPIACRARILLGSWNKNV